MRPGHLCAHRCSQSTYLKAIRGEGRGGGKRAAPDRILSRVRLCAFPMGIFHCHCFVGFRSSWNKY